jgi:hypothetical protein
MPIIGCLIHLDQPLDSLGCVTALFFSVPRVLPSQFGEFSFDTCIPSLAELGECFFPVGFLLRSVLCDRFFDSGIDSETL